MTPVFRVPGRTAVRLSPRPTPRPGFLDAWWAQQVAANPTLFDGPITHVSHAAWDGAWLQLDAEPRTFAEYLAAARGVPGADSMRSLAVNALPVTSDDRAVLVRTAATSGAAGRWKFLGGAVEPVRDGAAPEQVLHAALARELREEFPALALSTCATGWFVIAPNPGPVLVMLRVVHTAMTCAEVVAAFDPVADPDGEVTGLVCVPAERARLEVWLAEQRDECLPYVPEALRAALGHVKVPEVPRGAVAPRATE